MTLCLAFLLPCIALAQTSPVTGKSPTPLQSTPTSRATPQFVSDLIARVDDGLSFAEAKLLIDQRIDPSIDVAANLAKIEGMVADIKSMAGPEPSNIQLLRALREYIYENGTWNNQNAFSYDHTDPKGTKISNKLLSNYLVSHRGNCISMPFLFMSLGERLGLEMIASTAPLHVMVKYIDDNGKAHNLETTSGGWPSRDVWYRQNAPISDLAVENRVFLATLTRKETMAAMASVLVEYYLQEGYYVDAARTADATLKAYPNYASIKVRRGTAIHYIMKREFFDKYPNPADIPKEQIRYFEFLAGENDRSFNEAEALGWQPAEGTVSEAVFGEK